MFGNGVVAVTGMYLTLWLIDREIARYYAVTATSAMIFAASTGALLLVVLSMVNAASSDPRRAKGRPIDARIDRGNPLKHPADPFGGLKWEGRREVAFYLKVLDDKVVGLRSTAAPGRGWAAVADVPALIDQARGRNLPLHLRPGVYPSPPIDITAANGAGNPLTLTAQVGTVTIQLNTIAPYLIRNTGVDNVEITNIAFDGNNLTLTDPAPTAALVHFIGAGIRSFTMRHCDVRNSTAAGIACESGASGTIGENRIHACDSGVFSIDCLVRIERNWIADCRNNGIQVWTSRLAANGSHIIHNYIDRISSTHAGTGQFGNGVVVFRAYDVKVTENNIYNCSYSAIRLNAAGNAQVIGNYCHNLREVAIFVEAPGAGLNLDGGVVANNIVDTAGSGIHVANSGLYNDGVSRRVTVSANQIANLTRTYVPEEKGSTPAVGIIVEGSCNVVGNSIERAALAGIVLGTNNASTDLLATGNLVRACPMGIGYSANPSAGPTIITGNLISGYAAVSDPSDPAYPRSGAIVSVSFDGAEFKRDAPGGAPNQDYGNAPQTTAGLLTVGMNEAR